jgi:hypothetical protein
MNEQKTIEATPDEALDKGGLGSVVFDYYEFKLHACGTFTRNGVASSWYKDEKTQKPWIPAKRKTFVALVKQMVREGDFA